MIPGLYLNTYDNSFAICHPDGRMEFWYKPIYAWFHDWYFDSEPDLRIFELIEEWK